MSTRMLTSIQLSISLLTCTQIQRQTQSSLAVYMYMLYKILFFLNEPSGSCYPHHQATKVQGPLYEREVRFVCEATCSSGDYKWFRGSKEIPGETRNIVEKCVLHTNCKL